MDSIEQFVSFWGAVASIVAILISGIGGLIVFKNKLKKKQELELELLSEIQTVFSQRANSATTQGKRLDLFIYYDSELSMIRFNKLIAELQLATLHILSFVGWLFIASLDSNADYYLDKALSTGYLYEYFGLVFFSTTVFIIYINVSARYSLYKSRKKINAIEKGLADGFKEFVK